MRSPVASNPELRKPGVLLDDGQALVSHQDQALGAGKGDGESPFLTAAEDPTPSTQACVSSLP